MVKAFLIMLICSYPGQPDSEAKRHFVRAGDAANRQSEVVRLKVGTRSHYGKEMVVRGLYLDGKAQDRLAPFAPNRQPQL